MYWYHLIEIKDPKRKFVTGPRVLLCVSKEASL